LGSNFNWKSVQKSPHTRQKTLQKELYDNSSDMGKPYLPVGTIHVEVVGHFNDSNVTSHLWSQQGREVHDIVSQLSIPEALRVQDRDLLVL
jgi:hypothetical protein